MDPYLLTLAGTAGTSIVTLIAADGWQQARDGIVGIWRRFRPEAADGVAQALEVSRRSLLAAAMSGENDAAVNLEAHWRRRVEELLGEYPDAAVELDGLLIRLRDSSSGQTINGGVRLQARASGNGRIYQSAGDQHVTER